MRLIYMAAATFATQIVNAACPSIDPDTVVFIETFYEYENGEKELFGNGSGVIVRPQGYVLTAKHLRPTTVPEGASVTTYGVLRSREGMRYKLTVYPGPVIQADAMLLNFSSDLREKWPFLEIGSSDAIKVGDELAAWGFPLDAGRTRMEGYVSSLDGAQGTIQTDSRYARGMSGGPVVNEACRLIGIVSGGSQVTGFQFVTPHTHFTPLLAPFLQQAAASREFPLCRHPSHGLEKWAIEEKWSVESGWMGGGNNPNAYCGGVKLQREKQYPSRTVRLMETGEKHKSEYNPFKHDFYKYSCQFVDLWEPIYKELRTANCATTTAGLPVAAGGQ